MSPSWRERLFFSGFMMLLLVWPAWCVGQSGSLGRMAPPMGWNSWNYFGTKVTDEDVRHAADALVSSGLRNKGYVYVNIDDSWEGKRDASGVIQSNEKFPDMKALADYVHSKGLKLGIYSSPGPETCAHYPGSYGHEDQDAQTYALWGVDYLKYDLCSFGKLMTQTHPDDVAAQYRMMREAYSKMSRALKKTGRPIVYSLCQYGLDSVWEWGPKVGANLWRTTGDIHPTYERIAAIGFGQAGLSGFAGPGHWNDPDMLEIGNGKLTLEENRSHMTLWAMLSAPLIAGNDLFHMSPETLSVLGNRDVIAIDQDELFDQGDRAFEEGPIEVWVKKLRSGSRVIAIFNKGDVPLYSIPLRPILLKLGVHRSAVPHDLWRNQDISAAQLSAGIDLKKHDVLLLRVSR
jgi:alpha-galactosidase